MGSANQCTVPMMSLQQLQLGSDVTEKENPELTQSPEMGTEEPWVGSRCLWLKPRGVYKFKWRPAPPKRKENKNLHFD